MNYKSLKLSSDIEEGTYQLRCRSDSANGNGSTCP
jgi:hypothetical protein